MILSDMIVQDVITLLHDFNYVEVRDYHLMISPSILDGNKKSYFVSVVFDV